MTCGSLSEVDEAVSFIASKAPAKFYKEYKDFSRVLTLLLSSCNLFKVNKDSVFLNPTFEDYFADNFIAKNTLNTLMAHFQSDTAYSNFLYNLQNFNINLVDVPNNVPLVAVEKKFEPTEQDISAVEDDTEAEYIAEVDAIKEVNINEESVLNAHKNEPVLKSSKMGKKYKTNPLYGKAAIKRANYTCELDAAHKTFSSRKTAKDYMEAHHFIPVSFLQQVWDEYGFNLDCVENLICLCPNCHKAFHYGTKEVQAQLIDALYEKGAEKLKSIGFEITLEKLREFYGIKSNNL